MSWAEVVWLRKKINSGKRLVGSNSSIVKGFEQKTLLNTNIVEVGEFTPKFSGAVTIIIELNGSSPYTRRCYLYIDNVLVYSDDQDVGAKKIVTVNINVIAGEEYSVSFSGNGAAGVPTRLNISVGGVLSETNLVE